MKKHSGFTLMELMVGIAILAVLSAIAIPSAISWLSNSRFTSGVREVKAAIEDARMDAVKENTRAGVQFDNENNTYAVGTFDIGTGDIDWGNAAPLPARLDIEAAFGGAEALELIFNNRGMPADGMGSIEFTSPTDDKLWIRVNITGRARVTD